MEELTEARLFPCELIGPFLRNRARSKDLIGGEEGLGERVVNP
jgi:hypothetical protein